MIPPRTSHSPGDAPARSLGLGARAGGGNGGLRTVAFVLLLALPWISVDPFSNLASREILETLQAGDSSARLAYGGAAIFIVLLLPFIDFGALRALMRPTYLMTVALLAFSVVTSPQFGLSARRFIFSMIVVAIAAILPLLATGKRSLGRLLFAMALLIVGLSWIGLVVAPARAIHQANDLFAANHGGLDTLLGGWRGLYPHKNIAGAMMAFFVMIGLYTARSVSFTGGWCLAILAALFLFFTQAKTSIVLLPLSLATSLVALRLQSFTARAIVLLTPFVLIASGTIVASYFGIFSDLARWSPDTSFSGRSDIWEYAIHQVGERPLLGHGFSAFWRSENALFTKSLTAGNFAASSHNSFLEIALTSGIVAAFLATVWIVVLPLVDFQRCLERGADSSLVLLFLQIWVFGIYFSLLEAFFFDRGNPVGFTLLLATFCLRYLSLYPVRR